MKETLAIILACSRAREDCKKILIGAINERLKNLTLEQLVEIEHFMDDNLMI